MELALNFAWLLLAAAMVGLWLRVAPRDPASRRVQLAALAMLILILLPAISMTDDLMAAQNPAEADSSLRRDHDYSSPHVLFPAVPALPVPSFARLPLGPARLITAGIVIRPVADPPALASIQNRPPPSA